MIRRNGKKPEEIDDDYDRKVTRLDKTHQISSLRVMHIYITYKIIYRVPIHNSLRNTIGSNQK